MDRDAGDPQIEQGATLVGCTGGALQRIVSQVIEIAQIVGGIFAGLTYYGVLR